MTNFVIDHVTITRFVSVTYDFVVMLQIVPFDNKNSCSAEISHRPFKRVSRPVLYFDSSWGRLIRHDLGMSLSLSLMTFARPYLWVENGFTEYMLISSGLSLNPRFRDRLLHTRNSSLHLAFRIVSQTHSYIAQKYILRIHIRPI